MFNNKWILVFALVFIIHIHVQPQVLGEEDQVVAEEEISEVLSSLNSWDRVAKVLPWYEGKAAEVQAVKDGTIIQSARFTVVNGTIERCYVCSPRAVVRIDSRRVPLVVKHIEARSIPRLIYDATKAWFRVVFRESTETYRDRAPRFHLTNQEVEAILNSINTWEAVKPILRRNEGRVSSVSIVSDGEVYQRAKFRVSGGRIRRCMFCISDVDVRIDAAHVQGIIDHIESRDKEGLFRDASRAWFRVGLKGMTKIVYRYFYSL